MRLAKTFAKLLAQERVCRVATADHGGAPHVVPVCHVLVEGKLYFGAAGDSEKVRNIRANPRVAVVVDLYSDDWRQLKGVAVRGTARLIDRGREFRTVRGWLYHKFPQYPDESALETPGSVIVEVTPTHATSWGLE